MLAGELGAGKTVFVQGLAAGLEVKETVVSPTFTIVRLYEGRLPLYHFDLFRLQKVTPTEWASYEEYLYGDGVSVVEWGEKIEHFLTDYLILAFHRRLKGLNKRVIEASAKGKRGQKLLAEISLLVQK